MKKKLSEIVMKKMQQKKRKEYENRPRLQIIKTTLQNEIHTFKTHDKMRNQLMEQINKQNNKIKTMEKLINDLNQIGQHPHHSIKISSQFYAASKIPPPIKQFYRKSSNTLKRDQIIGHRMVQQYIGKQLKQQQNMSKIIQIQMDMRKQVKKYKKNRDLLKIDVAKQRLKYEDAKQKGNQIKNKTQIRVSVMQPNIQQLQIKKKNVKSLQQQIYKLQQAIKKQKIKYQQTFNQQNCKKFLKKLFDVKVKTCYLEEKIQNFYEEVDLVMNKNHILETSLIKKKCFVKFGKIESFTQKSPIKSLKSSRHSTRNQSQEKYNNKDENKRQRKSYQKLIESPARKLTLDTTRTLAMSRTVKKQNLLQF